VTPAKALAAYNWGPGNFDKSGQNLNALPPETQKYLSKLLGTNPQSGGGGSSTGPIQPPAPAGVGPYSATQMPAMPGDFGVSTAGPSQAAKVDPRGPGDSMIATGLAMMGGNGWHDSMAKAGEAFAGQQAMAQKDAIANAGFQNDAIERDTQAPLNAAEVAAKRAAAWQAINAPNQISAVQAAQLNQQARTGDITLYDAQQRAAATVEAAKQRAELMAEASKQATPFIVPGDGDKEPMYFTQTRKGNGTIEYALPDGSVTSQMPEGGRPLSAYTHPDPITVATQKANSKSETSLAQDASTARDQDMRFGQALDQLNKPGQNLSPGIMGSVGRALDNATGLNLTGNMTDQQVTDAMLKQDMLGQFAKNSKAGGGRGSDALRGFVMAAQPHLGQDPTAIKEITGVLRDANALPMKVNDLYNGKTVDGIPGLSPAERLQLRNSGSVAQWADQRKSDLLEAAVKRHQAAVQSLQVAPAPAPGQAPQGSGAPQRPPITAFGSGARPAPSAPPAPSFDPSAVPDMGVARD
jgi:hypothetical protein